MKIIGKYGGYLLEYILGNFLFNMVYSIVKTIVLKNMGAGGQSYRMNLIESFKETWVLYVFVYIIIVGIQIFYVRYLVKTLNKKLEKTKERRRKNEA